VKQNASTTNVTERKHQDSALSAASANAHNTSTVDRVNVVLITITKDIFIHSAPSRKCVQ